MLLLLLVLLLLLLQLFFTPKQLIFYPQNTCFSPQITLYTYTHARQVHAKYDFDFTDYAPVVFAKLRALWRLDAADYLVSLTRYSVWCCWCRVGWRCWCRVGWCCWFRVGCCFRALAVFLMGLSVGFDWFLHGLQSTDSSNSSTPTIVVATLTHYCSSNLSLS